MISSSLSFSFAICTKQIIEKNNNNNKIYFFLLVFSFLLTWTGQKSHKKWSNLLIAWTMDRIIWRQSRFNVYVCTCAYVYNAEKYWWTQKEKLDLFFWFLSIFCYALFSNEQQLRRRMKRLSKWMWIVMRTQYWRQ